ncbi:MAG: hypothetical protein JWR83_1146 [Aeromicrobium sp.]|nr:hypothetical protein [Aeromicrobium sp.]
MTAMTTGSTTPLTGLPRGRALTRDDLDAMPDDGHRYELIDGLLVVSPAPRIRHQETVAGMHLLLHAACPPELRVLFAPVDVALSDDTVMQPDLLVARRDDFTERDLPAAPVLAVEVLSPSARAFDLLLKKDRLQRAGCAHYWVIDPYLPAITTWQLVDGAYVDSGTATGDETLSLTEPFAIDIRPALLIS